MPPRKTASAPRAKRTPRTPPPGHREELGRFVIPGVPGTRRVRVHVPAGGTVKLQRPLLILLDGQNAFDDAGSFAGGWHAHLAVDKQNARRKVVAPVVMAIDHGNGHRIDELGPWPLAGMGGGATDGLLELISHTLLPIVHQRWRLMPGPAGHVIGGSSLGGLAALYAHFRRPEVFGGALCMSPSFWLAGGRIFDFVAAQTTPYQSRVYIDCGAREAGGRMLPMAREMAMQLARRGWRSDGDGALRLMWRPDSRGGHSEKHWRRRLPKALKFFFG